MGHKTRIIILIMLIKSLWVNVNETFVKSYTRIRQVALQVDYASEQIHEHAYSKVLVIKLK